MDLFVGSKLKENHKTKVGKLVSGMSCTTEGSNKTDQFRFLERRLGHDLLVTSIIFLLKSRAGNKIFSIKMPALQWKKFESDEARKGLDSTGFPSVFVVPPAAQKKTNWKKQFLQEVCGKNGKKTEKSRKG